jgi:CRISPR-associated protein Csx17
MSTIVLNGCTPQPLGNYLKALGVFRLVAEQADPAVRGWWSGGSFRLATLPVQDLVAWFKYSYRPSPIPTPWSLNSGWWPPKSQPPPRGDKRNSAYQALRIICAANHSRYDAFRSCLRSYLGPFEVQPPLPDHEGALPERLRKVLSSLERPTRKRSARSALQRTLRNYVSNLTSLQWLDAVGALARRTDEDDLAIFPLLADAGAEGVNSFAGNFYQRLGEHLPFWEPHDQFWQSEQGRLSERRLRSALFAESVEGERQADAAGALYFPGLVEAPNVGQRFVAAPKKRTNPWDFILVMEGLHLWAAAVTRRLMVVQNDRPSFPFFCESSLGGNASLGPTEVPGHKDAKTRGEVWCPLWDRPARLAELALLLAEGRVTVADRTAERAAEFAIGVSSLGTERGISSFARTGLLERSGSGDQRTTLAVPLGEWALCQMPRADIVAELLPFDAAVATSLQHHANQPRRLIVAREQFERAIFKAVGRTPAEREAFLDALGGAAVLEREIGVTCGKVKYKRGKQLAPRDIAPIQPLTPRWIDAADDGSTEFKLARAVASIAPWGALGFNSGDRCVGPLRHNLLPLQYENGRWKWDEHSRSAVWARGAGLFDNLAAVLRRRLVDASRATGKGLPLWSSAGAAFGDLLALWQGDVDQQRIEHLIHALALVDFSAKQNAPDEDKPVTVRDAHPADNGGEYEAEIDAAAALPRAYAVLKLCFVGGRLPPRPTVTDSASGEEEYPPHAPEILNLLLAGRLGEALDTAARKLRAKRYPSVVPESAFRNGEFAMTATETRRLAGLLLVPVRRPSILVRLAIKPVPTR